ncbi:hypothetical protein ACP70R_009621 [Stipagrostis hirtigluma subsp. patula]
MAATAEAPAAAGWVNHAAERRRRSYAMLDAADPARGRAVRCCEIARDMYRADGHMREARRLFRDALVCDVRPPTIYRGWIAMEEHAGHGADVRPLFEAWRAWYELVGGGGDDEAGFWCHYIAFELRHGGAARVREVARRAVAACPRDPAVHAKYAKAELSLGRADLAGDVLGRALQVFAKDDDAKIREWLNDEVKSYRDSMRAGSWRKLRGLLPFCRGSGAGGGWWMGPAGGYKRLGVA